MIVLTDYPAYENYYHYVGSTKYRKSVFLEDDMRDRLIVIVTESLEKKGIEVVAITAAYNHIHVLVKTDQDIHKVGQYIFGTSSTLMHKQYHELVEKLGKHLWGGTSCSAIKDESHLSNCKSYIERHQPDNTKLEIEVE